jgi:hypothetical protein
MKSYKQMKQSHKETDEELYNAIRSGGGSIDIVDIVEEGNMSAVTSNAVAKAIKDETSTGTVNIIVTKKETGTYVNNATVKLDETEQITPITGKCEFKNVDFGIHILQVTCENYEDYMGIIKVNEEFKTVMVELSEKTEEYATLNITVKNNNTSSVVEGAKVKVGNETLTTDSQGKCTFEDLQYTSYIINVYCTGYEDYTDSIFIDQTETNYTIRIIPEQEPETIRIAGTVLDQQGVLPDVTITDLDTGKSTTSDEDGYYVLDLTKPSTSALDITMSKTYYKTLSFTVKLDTRTYYDIPNKTLTLIDNPPAGSNMSGQAVYEEYGSPGYEKGAGNVKLSLICSGNTYPSTTDGLGYFKEYGLSAGSYNVEIKDNPDYKSEVFENAFFLRPDGFLEDIKITLTRITHDFQLVLVYSGSGEYVTNTKIEIYSDQDLTNKIADGETTITGKFFFTVPNELTDYLYGKVYVSSTDIRTITAGRASDTSNKVQI